MKTGSGRGFYGISLVLGIFALAEFILVFLPKLQPLGHLLDALEVYLAKVHPSLKGGLGDGPFFQLTLGMLLGWLASLLAIEAFSRKSDGLSLWANIAHDSCGLKPPGIRRWFCATTKWLATVLAGPLLIIWALLARLRSRTQFVTVGYITVDPGVVLEYVKHVVAGAAMLVAAVFFLAGDSKTPAKGAARAVDTKMACLIGRGHTPPTTSLS